MISHRITIHQRQRLFPFFEIGGPKVHRVREAIINNLNFKSNSHIQLDKYVSRITPRNNSTLINCHLRIASGTLHLGETYLYSNEDLPHIDVFVNISDLSVTHKCKSMLYGKFDIRNKSTVFEIFHLIFVELFLYNFKFNIESYVR